MPVPIMPIRRASEFFKASNPRPCVTSLVACIPSGNSHAISFLLDAFSHPRSQSRVIDQLSSLKQLTKNFSSFLDDLSMQDHRENSV
jgi:hypothetical protein